MLLCFRYEKSYKFRWIITHIKLFFHEISYSSQITKHDYLNTFTPIDITKSGRKFWVLQTSVSFFSADNKVTYQNVKIWKRIYPAMYSVGNIWKFYEFLCIKNTIFMNTAKERFSTTVWIPLVRILKNCSIKFHGIKLLPF